MARYSREEIMSSSEVVRNFGAVLSSVAQHRKEKIAIIRNNRLEAVLLATDVYERLEKACEAVGCMGPETNVVPSEDRNSDALLEFLRKNRLSAAASLSSGDIDRQILEEREAWE